MECNKKKDLVCEPSTKQVNRQIGRHTDRYTNRQTNQTDRQIYRQKYKHRDRCTDKQIDIQTNRQTDKQIDRQKDRQTDINTDRQTDRWTYGKKDDFIFAIKVCETVETCVPGYCQQVLQNLCELGACKTQLVLVCPQKGNSNQGSKGIRQQPIN